MLEANKSKLFEAIFAVYNKNLLKRRFNSLYVNGLEFLSESDTLLPQIIYCNHSSWWDGLVAFQISRSAAINSYIMMEEKHLERFVLFRRLGAFSVNREKPRQAAASLNYAADLLKSQIGCTLWIFPQGEIVNNERRPVFFYNGLSKIVGQIGRCRVTCMTIRYEFLGSFKPEIFVRIAEPEVIEAEPGLNAGVMTQTFIEAMTTTLDQLRSDIINGERQEYCSII